MVDSLYRFLFFIFSVFVLLKSIFYALYEIKTENNKLGGVALICFTVIVLIFAGFRDVP